MQREAISGVANNKVGCVAVLALFDLSVKGNLTPFVNQMFALLSHACWAD
jgi:hypothetical protein